MPEYQYKARSADGSETQGTIEAYSASSAAHDLLDAGTAPLEIRSAREGRTYHVSLTPGVSSCTQTWRLAYDDGTRAVWKTTRWKYFFGIVALLAGGGILYLAWVLETGIIARVIPGVVGGIMCLAGLAILATKNRMTLDRFTGRLDIRKSGSGRHRQYRRSDVEHVIAKWRFAANQSPPRGQRRFEGSWQLLLEARVDLVLKKKGTVQLEQCARAKHARALATKVAEYLQVPLHDTLDSPLTARGEGQ
jgi:hypothetical protein